VAAWSSSDALDHEVVHRPTQSTGTSASLVRCSATPVLYELYWLPVHQRIHFKLGCLSSSVLGGWRAACRRQWTTSAAICQWQNLCRSTDTTVSATEAFLLPDPECGTLYLKNPDRTQALESLGANWNHTCLSRLLNHGALWQIVFLRLINIFTYLLTYASDTLALGYICAFQFSYLTHPASRTHRSDT